MASPLSATSDGPESQGLTGERALSQSQLDEALAAEFVLGLVDDRERAEAEARIAGDRRFAVRVAAWRRRMADSEAARSGVDLPGVNAAPEPGLSAVRSAPPRRHTHIVATLEFLAGGLLAMTLVLATLAVFASPKPAVIAILGAPDSRLAYEVAEYGNSLRIKRISGQAPFAGTIHELWLLAPGKGPVSLGKLGDVPLVIDTDLSLQGSHLAVSLEPDDQVERTLPSGPLILATRIDG